LTAQKFKSVVTKLDSAVWNMHLPIPIEVTDHFLKTSGTRVVCLINNQISIQCALLPKGDGSYFININKEVRKKLGINLGDIAEVELCQDDSKYGLPLPPEMEELLLQDIDGERLFHKLTKGKQRSLLHIIGKPKTSDVRLRKALMTLDYLKSVNGKLDFRALNQFYKEYRDDYF